MCYLPETLINNLLICLNWKKKLIPNPCSAFKDAALSHRYDKILKPRNFKYLFAVKLSQYLRYSYAECGIYAHKPARVPADVADRTAHSIHAYKQAPFASSQFKYSSRLRTRHPVFVQICRILYLFFDIICKLNKNLPLSPLWFCIFSVYIYFV